MSKLAIDGGSRVFAEDVNFEVWPPVYPEVAEKLTQIYMSHKWSFYGAEEMKFAENFAKYDDAKFGTFMVNRTTTLESALKALGIGPGDEVIVPAGLGWRPAWLPCMWGQPLFSLTEKKILSVWIPLPLKRRSLPAPER